MFFLKSNQKCSNNSILILILIISILLFLFSTFSNSNNNNIDYFNSSTNPLTNLNPSTTPNIYSLKLFYADWCGFCVQFLPIWSNLENSRSDILFVKQDCTNDTGTNNDIKGFPTIRLYTNDTNNTNDTNDTNNKYIEYVGDRTIESLNKFIDDNAKLRLPQ